MLKIKNEIVMLAINIISIAKQLMQLICYNHVRYHFISPPLSLITTPPAPLKRFNFTSLQTLGKIQLPESPSKYIPTQTKYNSPKTLS